MDLQIDPLIRVLVYLFEVIKVIQAIIIKRLIEKKSEDLSTLDFDFHCDDHFESYLFGNGL